MPLELGVAQHSMPLAHCYQFNVGGNYRHCTCSERLPLLYWNRLINIRKKLFRAGTHRQPYVYHNRKNHEKYPRIELIIELAVENGEQRHSGNGSEHRGTRPKATDIMLLAVPSSAQSRSRANLHFEKKIDLIQF